ncbi:hypothetical protein QCD61_19190 [Pseudomonas viciae]|uniref:NACHT domain-containing protein n=1 Tax=Pseudomonas viciae TaxID=2505979 RepID=A0ABY8P9C9_9PSED|nr:hypothetical protein [Pseudomonas viciae]WGO91822.1 hypothetical protein QCD61_19190 [Pseudomonas viciae]
MDYDFSRLSHRSFEQMIQSLALASIGPGVNVFGDGPDGGREATFEGMSTFPDSSSPWTGYGIMQAKFRQRGGEKDGDWAITEFEKDLKKIAKNSKIRKPEYYIFVTNVILTPVSQVGGKDKLAALVKKYKDKIGLKDYRIWDKDQICALLDIYSDVRTAYTAWITSGDVLAAVLEQMKPEKLDFKSVMFNYIQKELRAEQFVNLGQAGHNVKDRIPLACVFVDLPVTDASSNTRNSQSHPDSKKSKNSSAINRLLKASSSKLDPNSNEIFSRSLDMTSEKVSSGRFVFIGGPGQGKSTLTQFFCQLHRASFLRQFPLTTLSPEILDAYNVILQQCEQESVETPNIPRFPIRIELNKFATALANGKATSLFNYILSRIEERSEQKLKQSDLRKWLSNYPWVIALDGLDEVPASSNRAEVLNSIQDFIIDAHGCNADLLLITTSRPQGYNNDFSEKYYQHLNLSPLDEDEALHYAKRLIDRRWGGDEDKTAILSDRMRRATKEKSTARLMQSPLQVTIMALLVETLGEPPKERWRLFNEYYQVINRREKERDIPAAKLLNTYQADIDFIHQKVGVNLQVKSEQAGGTEALLTEQEFSLIIKNRLDQEGHDSTEGAELKSNIINAALERLVFLVAPQESRIGFEIRSLQEFMAAQSLMNGSDVDVCARLQAIAHASHWRNVFLFASGRCFHEKQHLRDNIFTLCSKLNEGMNNSSEEDVEKAILTGSQLALDILEDGAIASQPTQQRIFSRLAIRIIELPNSDSHLRLATAYNPNLKDIYKENIEQAISSPASISFQGAWQVLLSLCYQNIEWATELALQYWPTPGRLSLSIAEASIDTSPSDWLVEKWYESIAMTPAAEVPMHRVPGFGERKKYQQRKQTPQWLEDIVARTRERSRVESLVENVDPIFKLAISSGSENETPPQQEPFIAHDSWKWLHSVAVFCVHPDKSRLSDIINDYSNLLENHGEDCVGDWFWIVPWQVSSCVDKTSCKTELTAISEAAKSGLLGDSMDWKEAEERWSSTTLTLKNINHKTSSGLPFDKTTLAEGYPSSSAHPYLKPGTSNDLIKDLVSLIEGISNKKCKSIVASGIFYAFSVHMPEPTKAPEILLKNLNSLLMLADKEWFDLSILARLPDEYWECSEIDNFIKQINKIKRANSFIIEPVEAKYLEAKILRNPGDTESIKLLSRICSSGASCNIQDLNLKISASNTQEINIHITLIHLTQGEYTLAEAINFADYLIKTFPSTSDFESTLSALLEAFSHAPRVTEATELFLYSIYKSHLYENLKIRELIINSLQEHQRYHLSRNKLILA